MYSVQLDIRICLHKHTRALKTTPNFALQKIHLSPGTQGIKHLTRMDAKMSHQRARQQPKNSTNKEDDRRRRGTVCL